MMEEYQKARMGIEDFFLKYQCKVQFAEEEIKKGYSEHISFRALDKNNNIFAEGKKIWINDISTDEKLTNYLKNLISRKI